MMMGNKTGVTRAIEELVKRGWITQEIYDKDRRNRMIKLTEEGEHMVPKLFDCAMQTIAEVTSGIDKKISKPLRKY